MFICLLFVPVFAEEAADCIDLFPYIGTATRDEFRTDVSEEFISAKRVSDGVTMYLGNSLADGITMRCTHEECEETYGWDHRTVFYVSICMDGYSLMGIRVGDTPEDIADVCLSDGWTEMAEAPQNCDGGYEKTIDSVNYTLGYIIEYGTNQINLVYIKAVNI